MRKVLSDLPPSKSQILNDVKRVASNLNRAPSRDEYCGRSASNQKPLGEFTEHQIRKYFGKFSDLLAEAGLSGYRAAATDIKVTDPAGLRVAKADGEIARLKSYIKELERETMDAAALRSLIGAADTTQLGEGADWLKGPREIRSSITGTPTLFLSDVHFDEVVEKNQVGGVNEYNHDIAVARLQHTFQTAVDLTKRYMFKPTYDGFIVMLGGDMFSGNIHEELAETNEQTIIRSVLDLGDILAAGIEGIADEFGKVFVPCVVGNHGRLHKKPRYKYRVEHNFEYLLYQMLSRRFINDTRITFLIPDAPDAQYTLYENKTFNLNHGDQFKGGSGISGIFTPLLLGAARKQKKQSAISKPFDVMCCGHFHQYLTSNGIIVNGSVKGYDEFANMHNFSYEPAQQALWVNHPTKGEIYRMPVLCDKEVAPKGKKTVLSW